MKFASTIFLFLLSGAKGVLFSQQQAPNWGWPVVTDHLVNHNGKVVGTPGEYRDPYETGAGAPAFNPFPGYNAFTVSGQKVKVFTSPTLQSILPDGIFAF